MPTWREKVQRKLADTCIPKIKMHFDLRQTPVNVHDSGFLDSAKVLCEKRGCRAIVTETIPGSNFSKVLFHDEPRDLETVPLAATSKRKKKSKVRAASVRPVGGKVYKCWVLE